MARESPSRPAEEGGGQGGEGVSVGHGPRSSERGSLPINRRLTSPKRGTMTYLSKKARPRYSKYSTEIMSRELSGAGSLVLDFNPADFAGSKDFKISELAEMLENYASDLLTDNDFGAEHAREYAEAFLRQVNYRAIARQLLEGEQ